METATDRSTDRPSWGHQNKRRN